MVLPLGLLMLLSVRFIWLRLLLVGTLLVWFLSGVSLMILMLVWFLHVCLTPLRFGLMVVLSWIRLLVFPLLVLENLLTSLSFAGVVAGGVMLIVFNLRMRLILVGVLCLSLGLCRLFRGG